MLKKILALAAGLAFSLSASASYTQYNLSGGLSGFIIENDKTKSIVEYDLYLGGNATPRTHFEPSGAYGTLDGTSSSFWGMTGPTDFHAYDSRSEVYDSSVTVYFNGMYSNTPDDYSAYFTNLPDPGYPRDPWVTPLTPSWGWVSGTAVGTAVPPDEAAYFDQYGADPGLTPEIPVQNVPEPASLALLSAGVVSAFGAIRRRKKSS